ncbi:hypothetical protein ASG07_15565 [Sphingomonas sp. Leaf343]|nr:hypothetical protein ASG07_15565 [Sphingomonas sp. Leaf343]
MLVRAVARKPERFHSFFGNMLMLIGLTIIPVVLGALWIAAGPMKSEIPVTLLLAALTGEIVAARIAASVELIMVAHGHTTRASGVRLAMTLTRLIAALLYFSAAKSLQGWILVVLGQSILFGAALLVIAMRLYGSPVFMLQRSELAAGAAFSINQAARATQGNVDRVILARFSDASVLGAYAAGARILAIGLFPLQVITRLLYPNFFREGEFGLAATRRYALKCLPAMLATGLFASASVAAVAQVIPLVLGHDFAASRGAAMLLGLSLPLIAMQYLAADTLTGAGLQHIRAVIYGIAALIFGFLLAMGAYFAGVTGLIVAFLSAHALLMAVLWIIAFTWKDSEAAQR